MVPLRRFFCLGCFLWLFGGVRVAEASPSVVSLSGMTLLRLQNISFFLLVLLIATLVFRWLWNSLGQELFGLPRLSFRKALTLTVLWGLLFAFVLTMIAGLTPQTLKKCGLLYEIADEKETVEKAAQPLAERKDGLTRLGTLLSTYAVAHDGNYPPRDIKDIQPHSGASPAKTAINTCTARGERLPTGGCRWRSSRICLKDSPTGGWCYLPTVRSSCSRSMNSTSCLIINYKAANLLTTKEWTANLLTGSSCYGIRQETENKRLRDLAGMGDCAGCVYLCRAVHGGGVSA